MSENRSWDMTTANWEWTSTTANWDTEWTNAWTNTTVQTRTFKCGLPTDEGPCPRWSYSLSPCQFHVSWPERDPLGRYVSR